MILTRGTWKLRMRWGEGNMICWIILLCVALAFLREVKAINATQSVWTGPQTTHVEAGTNLTLTCASNNTNSTASITWLDQNITIFYNSDRISPGVKYANFRAVWNNASSSILHINSVEVEDEGTYSCQSYPAFTSEGALLHVEVASNFTMSTVPAMVNGNEYTVSCNSTGARPGETITWYLDDYPVYFAEVTDNITVNNYSRGLYDTTSSVTFRANRYMHGGVLACETSGHTLVDLQQRREAELEIISPPENDSLTLAFEEDHAHNILRITCHAPCPASPYPPLSSYNITLEGDARPIASGSESVAEISPIPARCINVSCQAGNGQGETAVTIEFCPGASALSCKSREAAAIALGVLCLLFIGVIAFLVFTTCRRRTPAKDTETMLTRQDGVNGVANPAQPHRREGSELYEALEGQSSEAAGMPAAYAALNTTERDIIAKQVDVQVPQRNIRFHSMISPLGEGAFGRVWKGEIRGVPGKERKRILAAIRDTSDVENDTSRLLESATRLWKLPYHVNIVKCLGCCVKQGLLVNEYVPNGTLLTYLQTNAGSTGSRGRGSYRTYQNVRSIVRRVKEPDVLRFAWQIAKGMEFLASEKVLHGNLRANNILLSENKLCKIADYGLNHITSRAPILHRWMSPEMMAGETPSSECDVWSFGVVVWELVTLGAQPYPGIMDEELKERVQRGYRMRRPRHCGQDLFDIISNCWKTNPRLRSNFSELVNQIGRILEGASDYLSLKSMEDSDSEEYMDIPEL